MVGTNRIQFWLLLVSAVTLIILFGHEFWGTSVDYAHHYSLVVRLFELWKMPGEVDPSLGEMNVYPRYAHALAASLGILVGSPFLGMHLVSLISLMLLWYAIALILRRQDERGLLPHLLIALVLIVIAGRLRLEIHGFEIVGNYFFSQLAGQFLVFLCLAIHTNFIDRYGSLLFGYIFLSASAVLIAGFHLLPAVELLGVLAVYFLTDTLKALSAHKASTKNISLAFAVILCAAIATYLHPSFTAMKNIALNNGDVWFRYTPTIGMQAILCIVVLVLSLAGLWYEGWVKNRNNSLGGLRIISSYGLVMSGLFALQFVCLKLGYGSEYACKKYGFGLNTALLLLISFIATELSLRLKWLSGFQRVGNFSDLTFQIYPALVMVVAFLAIHPKGSQLDAKRMELADVAARNLFSIDPPLPGEAHDMFYGVEGLRNVANYMFSIGALHHPRDQDSLRLLAKDSLPPGSRLRYLVSGRHGNFDFAVCRKYELVGEMVAVDASCALAQAAVCPPSISFSLSGNVLSTWLDGFSVAEPFGRWIDGKRASFRCVLPQDLDGEVVGIRLDSIIAFVPHGGSQHLKVTINHSIEKDLEVGASAKEVIIDLRGSPLKKGGEVSVDFEVPGAVSPRALGISADSRELGIGIKGIDMLTNSIGGDGS